jgi:hypothetical protein
MAKKTELIGYCGAYCPDCPSHTQEVADLARDLRKVLRRQKIGEYVDMMAEMPGFEAFKHYKKGYELLGALMKIRCKNKYCRAGGWGGRCKIKACARKKGFRGCWECEKFEDCETLHLLEEGDDAPHLKNLRKLKRMGPTAFVRAKSR